MLGRYGIAATAILRSTPLGEVGRVLARLEEDGAGSVWFGENVGDEAFANAGVVLAQSRSLVAATGVANVAARAPAAMAAGRRILTDAYPRRFALGIGVSHAAVLEAYGAPPVRRPLAALDAYLDAMAAVPGPDLRHAPMLVAALGPRMLELAARRGLGVHAWNVTPEHTRAARASVGPLGLVAPRQAVLLCEDPTAARSVARAHLADYLGFPNYVRAWMRQGYGEHDLADGGSDRLVDHMVAWGGPDDVLRRLREHWDAGADHVAVHALARRGRTPTEAALEVSRLLSEGPSRGGEA